MNRLTDLKWDDLEAQLRPLEREADQWAKATLEAELAALNATLRKLGGELPQDTIRDFQFWRMRCSTWLFLILAGTARIERIPDSGLLTDAQILYMVPLN